MYKIKKISIIVPIYNEEKSIIPLSEEIISVLDKIGSEYEIIFSDDGSSDNSPLILDKLRLKYPAIKVVHLDRNYGQTTSLRAGFDIAAGNAIITMDGDLQNDPRDIPKLLYELGEFDMACGWRKIRHDPLIIKVTSKIANFIRNIFTHDKIKDIGCGLKAYRRECFEKLKLFKRLHRFFPVLAIMEDCKVTQIPINHRARKFGKSKYKITTQAFTGLIDLCVVIWMKKNHIKYKLK